MMNTPKKLKQSLSLTLVILMAFAMTACGGGAASKPEPAGGNEPAAGNEPVTVTFWNGWTGPDGELLRQLVDQYNDKNTKNVTIAMDIMEFASLNEKLATALASNTNPNLHLGTAVGEYSIEGQYIPIDDIFEKTNLDKADFDPGVLENCYYNGKLYGLPFQLTSQYLFYNKDLFEQAGLDPNTPPATWEDLLQYSKQIDALGDGVHGGGFSFNNAMVLGSMMVSYGGMVVADDEQGMRSALADPKYIDANRKALEIIYEYAHQSDWNQMNDNYEAAYQAGTVGMFITGAWQLAGAKDYNINYGVALTPAGTDGIAQPGWPISMCVMKNTKDRALEGAYDFMNYWNNNTGNPITDEAPAFVWTQKQGYQSYLLSVANDSRLTSDPDYVVTSSYIDHYRNYYPGTFWNFRALGDDILVPLAENVVYDLMSIDEALQEAHDSLNAMIANMKF